MKLRRTFAVVLCLLLLSLQSQALVHPLSHLRLGKPQQTGLASSIVDATCVECALLAGGSTAAVADPASLHFGEDADAAVVIHHYRRAPNAPAWFQSRAPPARLV